MQIAVMQNKYVLQYNNFGYNTKVGRAEMLNIALNTRKTMRNGVYRGDFR